MTLRLTVRVLLSAVAVMLVLAGCGGSQADKPETTAKQAGKPSLGPAFGSMDALPGVLKTPPPWRTNDGKLQQRLRAIGLPALTEEGQVVHIHQHLDLFVDGKPVEVPGNIGIGQSFISPLHTHDPNGILHVESPTASTFSLGQLFAIWGVRLDRRCIGGLCAGNGKELRAWVDGTAVDADPTRIVLGEKQQIVLAFGTPQQMPDPVPASYAFPADL